MKPIGIVLITALCVLFPYAGQAQSTVYSMRVFNQVIAFQYPLAGEAPGLPVY